MIIVPTPDKGIEMFEWLESKGYRVYQESGIWVVDVLSDGTWARDVTGGSHDTVNALMDAFSPTVQPRLISGDEFLSRLGLESQRRIADFGGFPAFRLTLVAGREVLDLHSPIVSETLDAWEIASDENGPLLTAEQRVVLVA